MLYSTDMTGLYSGGLVYEYSLEQDSSGQKGGFGLVTITGNTVSDTPDFNTLLKQFKNVTLPSGDGGSKSSSPASTCPTSIGTYTLNNSLPLMPADAAKYMTNGAGKGLGMNNPAYPSSQWAPGASSGWGPAGSASDVSTGNGTTTGPKKGSAVSNTVSTLSLVTLLAIPWVWTYLTNTGLLA